MSIVLIEIFNPILTVIRVQNEYYKDTACKMHAYSGDIIHGNDVFLVRRMRTQCRLCLAMRLSSDHTGFDR